jgi:hypothetical protein
MLQQQTQTIPPNPNPDRLAQEALHRMGDYPAKDDGQSDWVRPAKGFIPFAGFTATSPAKANRLPIPNTWQETMICLSAFGSTVYELPCFLHSCHGVYVFFAWSQKKCF